MIDIPLEYWNKLANQLLVISSLLGGFSIAVIANIIIYKSNNRFLIHILKTATVAAGSFLISIFAMTKILMMTTSGYPINIVDSDLVFPRMLGFSTFYIGILSLSIVISLSGWTKSKSTGLFTTAIGILTFLLISLTLVEISY